MLPKPQTRRLADISKHLIFKSHLRLSSSTMFPPSYLHLADFGIIAVVGVLVITVVLLFVFGFGKSSKGTFIPGPERSDPEDGNLDDVRKAGSLHEYMVYLHDTYGRVVGFWWGKTYTVSVACPVLWKDMQGIFDRPYELFKMFEPLFGKKSIGFQSEEKGRRFRRVTDRSFNHQAVMNYYDCILEAAKEIEAKWESLPKGEHIPLGKNMMSLAYKSMGLAGLGETFRDDKEAGKFIKAYETVSGYYEKMNPNPSMLSWIYLITRIRIFLAFLTLTLTTWTGISVADTDVVD